MHNLAQFTASIIAETIIAKTSGNHIGVLGENLPKFDVAHFVQVLEEGHPTPFWLALLGGEGIEVETTGKAEVTYDVTIANRWRNLATEEKDKKLVVIILGSTPKLKSLRDLLVRVTENEIRPVIESKAVSWFPTEPRKAFWQLLCADRDGFKTSSLLDFASAMSVLAAANPNDLCDHEETNLHKLGMFPHLGILEMEGPKNIEKSIKANLNLVERIKALSRQDLATISRILEDETTTEAEKETVKGMLAFSKSKERESLKGLVYSEVTSILAQKKSERKQGDDDATPNPIRKERELGDESAIRDLIRNEGRNLADLAEMFQRDPEDESEPKEFNTDGRTIIQKQRVGVSQIGSAVNQLITDRCYGGIVKSDFATDYIDSLKILESGEAGKIVEFLPNDETEEKSVKSILNKVLLHYGDSAIGDACTAWTKYIEARNALLEYRFDLTDHPLLLLASDKDVLSSCDILVKAYGAMLAEMAKVCNELRSRDVNFSKTLMAKVLALDIVYLDYDVNGSVAIAGPTHPFHLWRWIEIARLFHNNAEDMRKLGEDLLLKHAANPPVFSPHVTMSVFLAPDDIAKDRVYMGIGSIGALPLYGDPESRVAVKFRAEEIADISSRFVAIAPYAGFGFEVAAIDPPSVSDIIEAVVSVNKGRNRNNLVPVHVRIFFTRKKVSMTDEEDDEMEELATVIREIKGTLEIEPKDVSLDDVDQRLQARPAHYTLVFEPGESQRFDISIEFSPTLSPLVIPRHYHYSELSDRFDVIIHGDATPFGMYYEMFKSITNIPDKGTFGRRSGAGRNADKIEKIAKNTMWISVIDQGIEPTFKVANTIRLDKRTNSGRDIHTFTAHPSAISRYVMRVVEKAGLIPDELTQRRTFELMQRLGGDTIPLAVASASKNGQIITTQAKGLLGVLSVKAWYEMSDPDALLISLDTEASRRWILGIASEEDGRRGDLLCLRQTYEGLQLEVVEVKAREEDSDLYKMTGAATIEGRAIGQIDNTAGILKRILPKSGTSSVDKARREILRDQLYMAVAHRELSPEQRVRAVRMLDEFFNADSDSIKILGRLFVVHVETQKTPKYPMEPISKKNIQSSQGNPIEVYEILESEVDEPFEEEETPFPGPGGEPGGGEEGAPDKSEEQTAGGGTVPSATGASDLAAPHGEPAEAETAKPGGHAFVPSAKSPVLVGKDPLGNEVTWDSEKNPNFGISVTGDPGYGKTQTIRAFISELRKQGYPVLVFDFKDDYSDDEFVGKHNLTVYDVVKNGLPFNPLSLIPNEDGEVQAVRQCHDLSSIIARIEGLKEQQHHRLVEALKKVYENHGIDPRARIRVEDITSEPVFDEVLAELNNGDNVAKTVLYRLNKFSDLGLFPTRKPDLNFDELVQDGIVLTLNDEANARLMQILAEIMVVKLHAMVKRGDQPRTLRRMLVFDEAWRIAKSQRLVDLAREGRAFGVGIIIGTQKPKDIPESLMSCLRAQIYLFNSEPDDQKIVLKSLCNTTSGPVAERHLRAIKGMGKFEGYIQSDQYKQGIRVNIVPYCDRGK